MSTNQIIQGVKIYLPTEFTQDTSIGLYTSGGESEFRWIENPLAGLVEVWNATMLLEGGIPETSESANWNRGGDVGQVSEVEISIDNTSQFFDTVDNASIYMSGLRCEIIEFSKAVATGTITETIKYRGVTKVGTWNRQRYSITLEPAHLNRIANIVTQINTVNYPNASSDLINTEIPATFGQFYDGRYARMSRTADAEEIYVTAGSYGSRIGTDTVYINLRCYFLDGDNYFPVVATDGDVPPITYNIKLGFTGYVSWIGSDGTDYNALGGQLNLDTWFANRYIKVVAGTGEGEYRAIASAQVDFDVDDSVVEVTLTDYFEDTLAGNATATAEQQSWVKFLDIQQDYAADVWPCKSFLDDDGNEITQGFSLYSYAQSSVAKVTDANADAPVETSKFQYLRLPQYAYNDSGNGDNNAIDIDVALFDSSVNTMNSFLILPMKSVALNTDSTEEYRSVWGPNDVFKGADGFYASFKTVGNPELIQFGFNLAVGDLQNLIGNDYNSYAEYLLTFTISDPSPKKIILSVICTLPDVPDSFTFDDAYLGTKTVLGFSETTLNFAWQRWIGAQTTELSLTNGGLGDSKFESMLDAYYSSDPNLDNKYFYPSINNVEIVAEGLRLTSGYRLFHLPNITNPEVYKSISRCNFSISSEQTTEPPGFVYELYKLAIILRKSVSIKDAIYTPFAGRTFADTWDTRKTAEDLIENPIDMFEHVCRLQNWSEEKDTTTSAGKAYSSAALIKTDAEVGSFDYVGLTDVKARRPSFQVLSYDKGWTDVMKKDFCRTFWLTNYVDEAGKECVAYLPKSVTPTETIDLGDVPVGMRIGDVIEPQVENVYAEPFVRYNYNAGSKKFDGFIGVNNVPNGTWGSAFTPGISGSDGERIYDRCNSELWASVNQITRPPSDMTDKYMITTYADALWYLDNWITWMTRKRIPMPVYYTLASSWHIGRHVYLNLPHQTTGLSVEGVVESITKYKNAGYCALRLVILDDLPDDYYIKDVMYNEAGGASADWVDTMTEYGNSNDKVDVI